MTVDVWARREAAEIYGGGSGREEVLRSIGFEDGAGHAFDALLSDKASIAGAKRIAAYFRGQMIPFDVARAALQAAIAAVTEGDTE